MAAKDAERKASLEPTAEELDLSQDSAYRGERRRLEQRLETLRHADRLTLRGVRPDPVTEEERKALRALGYLD